MGLFRRNHLERSSRLHCILTRAAKRLATATVETEIGQLDDCLFPELEQREAEIDVDRQVLGTHLVEHRPSAMLVSVLAESPRQLSLLALLAERVTEGDPAATRDAIHDHAAAGIAEEK